MNIVEFLKFRALQHKMELCNIYQDKKEYDETRNRFLKTYNKRQDQSSRPALHSKQKALLVPPNTPGKKTETDNHNSIHCLDQLLTFIIYHRVIDKIRCEM